MDTNDKYPFALPKGTVLSGQYLIETVLGQGGFGITYRAIDHRTGERVAVKEYFPEALAGRTDKLNVTAFSGDRGEGFNYGKDCFLQEAETLAAFIGNEHIVRVHTYFEENGTAYFVMDYVDGTSLDRYIRNKGGRISYEDAERILLPIMDALAAVNSKGIVHRDVTPDNIYITVDGNVKLLDFGAARFSLGDRSKSLDVVLKHGFAPKEQYTRRGRQGAFTDVYSLGATFYYSITGRRPPDSIDRIDEDILVPPGHLGVRIPLPKERAILTAMSVNAQDRYQTMPEFKQALLSPVVKPVGNTVSSSRTVSRDDPLSLLERRMMLHLEGEEWRKAKKCSEQILAKYPENAMAYIAKLMIKNKYRTIEQLKNHKTLLENENFFNIAMRYADDGLRTELEGCSAAVKLRRFEERVRNDYRNAGGLMEKGDRKSLLEAKSLLESLGNYNDAPQMLYDCNARIKSISDEEYRNAVNLYNSGTIENYVRARRIFSELGTYRNSEYYYDCCDVVIEEKWAPKQARKISRTIRTVIIMLLYVPFTFIMLLSFLISLSSLIGGSDWKVFTMLLIILAVSIGKIVYSFITHTAAWDRAESHIPIVGRIMVSKKVRKSWFRQTLLRLLFQIIITLITVAVEVVIYNLNF